MSDDDECSLWIAGDTNLPDIDWTNNAIVGHQYVKQINETSVSYTHLTLPTTPYV